MKLSKVGRILMLNKTLLSNATLDADKRVITCIYQNLTQIKKLLLNVS